MMGVLLVLVGAYIVWELCRGHDGCEKPDCDNCPFPKCNRRDD